MSTAPTRGRGTLPALSPTSAASAAAPAAASTGSTSPSESAGGAAAAAASGRARRTLDQLSGKQLKQLLQAHGAATAGCVERQDFLALASALPADAVSHFLARQQACTTAAATAGCPHFDAKAVAALRALQRPPTADEVVDRLSREAGTKGVQALLKSQGVDTRGLCEKAEFLDRAKQLIAAERAAGPGPGAGAGASGAASAEQRGGDLRNLARVRYDLAAAMRSCPPSYDDGSYIPLMIRFAWHCCGTYDAATGTGGSNGCTMRFPAEQADPENAGLARARDVLAGVHAKHPWLSLADLYVLAGYVAIEESGGPAIPFAYGRRDFTPAEAAAVYGPGRCPFARKDGTHNPHKSRLPAADLGADPAVPAAGGDPAKREAATIRAMRGTFHRMGFDDKETVCLIVLGHQYGRCHPENSGFRGSWYGFSPTEWNIYGPGGLGYLSVYQAARHFKETVDPQTGKRQWNNTHFGGDPSNPAFMMLAVDMALTWDPEYKRHLDYYNQYRLEFRSDAARAWKKLTELGCPPGLLLPERNAVPMCACQGRARCKNCRYSH